MTELQPTSVTSPHLKILWVEMSGVLLGLLLGWLKSALSWLEVGRSLEADLSPCWAEMASVRLMRLAVAGLGAGPMGVPAGGSLHWEAFRLQLPQELQWLGSYCLLWG